MPEFIPRRRESGLAALIAQMQAGRNDTLHQGIMQAGQAIGGGIAARADASRSAEAGRQKTIAELLEKGTLEGRTGTVVNGQNVWDAPAPGSIPLREAFGDQGYPAGMSYRPSKTKQELDKTKILVTPEMAKQYKGLVSGTEISSTFLADLESKTREGGKGSGKQGQLMENQLRDELNKMSGDFDKVTKSYSDILSVTKKPSAAGDLSLIFSYMKMLDPGSTVREGEQATAENARGIPSAIRNQYNKIMKGEKLAPEQRMDFLDQAHNLYNSQETIQRGREESYKGLAKRNQVNPENVIVPRGIKREKESTPIDENSTLAPVVLTGAKAARIAVLRAKAKVGGINK